MAQARRLSFLVLGFVALWLLLDRSAALLGSFRGERGLIVCAIVLVAAVLVERLLSRAAPWQALRDLGLRAPHASATVWGVVICAGMLCYYPAFAAVTGAQLRLRPDALGLLPGLFAQGGVAEEAVFRGFLFRRMREGRTFWRAAFAAAIPFIAVHLLLFLSMDAIVATAAVLLAVSISFPLAWLFERSGGSLWMPALVHFVVQGSIKIVEAPPENFLALATGWMLIGGLAPWLFFLVLRNDDARRSHP